MSLEKLLPASLRDSPLLLRTELIASGVTDREIRWRLRTGQWVQLRFGIYIEAEVLAALASYPDRLHAVYVLAARQRLVGDLAASHESAGLMLGMRLLDAEPGVHLTRDSEQLRHVQRYKGLSISCADLPPEHLHPGGFECVALTGGTRTALDLGRARSLRQAVVAADSALQLGLTTPEQLAEMYEWMKQWPGAQQAAQMLRLADGRRESVLESISYVGFDEVGLEMPEPQVTIGDGHGQTARVDALWRRHHTIGEADGMGKYQDRADKVAEGVRQEWAQDLGYEFVRWGWEGAQPGARMRATAQRIRRAWARGHARWGD